MSEISHLSLEVSISPKSSFDPISVGDDDVSEKLLEGVDASVVPWGEFGGQFIMRSNSDFSKFQGDRYVSSEFAIMNDREKLKRDTTIR